MSIEFFKNAGRKLELETGTREPVRSLERAKKARAEIQRELGIRRGFYPKQVRAGKANPRELEAQYAAMRDALAIVEEVVATMESPGLFG